MRAMALYQSGDAHAVTLVLQSSSSWSKQGADDAYRSLCDLQQFKALLGELAYLGEGDGSWHTIYIGTGDEDDVQAIASVVNRLPAGAYAFQQTLSLRAMVIWSLAQYRFDEYNTTPEMGLRVLVTHSSYLNDAVAQASAVFLARDLINRPANACGPQQLTQELANLAQHFNAEYKEWVGDELIEHHFPAVHAVGRAASQAPRLAQLTWGQQDHPRVTLVGKGVCFDSGGLDIKPASAMRLMKKDMGGAAIAIGLAQWLMAKKVPIRLHVLIPAVENAVASEAYRPGDVLTMRNGMTVEIEHTDAEGRLILADALVKAFEDNPDLVIDFATLTGAARVAVGTELSAFFTADDALAERVMQAGASCGDGMWRLPLFAGYDSLLRSQVADLSNATSSPYAGAITAALFLSYFVKKDRPWIHIDTMAWNVSTKPGRPEGGEAMSMSAMFHLIMHTFNS